MFVKNDMEYLVEMYDDIKERGWEAADRRIDFHGFVGNKYDHIYVDVKHIDNSYLKPHLDLGSFNEFFKSVNSKAKPVAEGYILENIENTKKVFAEHRNDSIVFFRTIKHKMTEKEYDDLTLAKNILYDVFKNSKLIVITDDESNFQKHDDLVFM